MMTDSGGGQACSQCHSPLASHRLQWWEGEAWCSSCLRRIAVPLGGVPRASTPLLEPVAWERRDAGPSLAAFFQAWWMVCVAPFAFYERMPRHAGGLRSVAFVLMVATLVATLSLPGNLWVTGHWFVPWASATAAEAKRSGNTGEDRGAVTPQPAGAAVGKPLAFAAPSAGYALGYQWLLIVLHTVVGGLLLHASLLLANETHPFETIQRVQRYATGAAVVLLLPSVLGAALWPFFQIALVIAGLHACCGVRIGKALLIAAFATGLFFLLFSLALQATVAAVPATPLAA